MGRFMINMHKGTFDIRKDLNFILKLLTNIVGFPQWGGCVHDNVHLDDIVLFNNLSLRNTCNEAHDTYGSALRHIVKSTCDTAQLGLRTHVVRPHSIDFVNFTAKCHSLVDDEL